MARYSYCTTPTQPHDVKEMKEPDQRNPDSVTYFKVKRTESEFFFE